MPVSLTFINPLNASCQVGDFAYYVPTSSSGGFSVASQSNIVSIGPISSITGTNANPTITINNNLSVPPSNAYIFFAKDNKANLSSLLGYFAEVKLKNTGTVYAELFGVAADTFESSK
jgi:hypothetical protein|tara:strand:+ start:417 stop:770 length:354 start_codon:yes stop_codon:yes gene_type:complete